MNLQLLQLTPELLDRISQDPQPALEGLAIVAPENTAWLKEICTLSRDFYQRVGAKSPWLGYLAIDADAREVVGTGGFKGNPTVAGEVEIAYGTFKGRAGRGVATATARQLTAIALGDPAIHRVLAHTLPERNASCRVLEKAGYHLAGEVIDPEDGRVWRWERMAHRT